jgi:pimeloyl-ACP methyl ester carboxylesterase
MELLAHSAGSILATLYAAAYPQRLSKLVLVTPGLAAVGVKVTEEQLATAIGRHAAEPWYAEASAAWEKMIGEDRSLAVYRASRPLFYGRWDETAHAHALSESPRAMRRRARATSLACSSARPRAGRR